MSTRRCQRSIRAGFRNVFAVACLLLLGVTSWAETIGVPDWQASVLQRRGQGVALDATNNAYLASVGIGVTSLDRFSATGVLQWSRTLLNGANGAGAPVITDSTGNAIVLGQVIGKYAPTGTLFWSQPLPGASVGAQIWSGTTDASGDIYVAASDSFTAHLVLSRLSGATGQTLWTNTLPDPNLYSAQLKRSGTRLVVSTGNDARLLILQVDTTTGAVTASYNAATAGTSSDVAIGPGGEIVVVGGGSFNLPGFAFTLLEFDSSLTTLLLSRSYPEGISARRVAIDAQRNIYLTGTTLELNPATTIGPDGTISQGPYADWLTMKLDQFGTPLWSARLSQRTDLHETPQVLRIGGDGSIYVAGLAGNPSSATRSAQATTVQYSAAGTLLWSATSTQAQDAIDVQLATDGSVFVVGGSPQSTLWHYPALAKPNALTLSRTTVAGGATLSGTVRVSSTAGTVVALASSNPAVVRVPATVTIPAGASSATFTIATSRVRATTTVGIGASANGGTVTATLTVKR